MPNARHLSVFLAALILSGCTQPSEKEIPEQNNPDTFVLILSDCFGFELQGEYPWLLAPGDSPAGWEFELARDGRLETAVLLEGLHCNRISTLDFERGPLSIVFESHSRAIPPEECRSGSWSLFWILNRLFIDDIEVATALSDIGFPSNYVNVSVSLAETMLAMQDWSIFHPKSGAESTLKFTTVSAFDDQSRMLVERFAWAKNDELMMMDVTWTNRAAEIPTVAEVSLSSEFLMTESSFSPPYIVDFNDKMEARGELVYRGDLACDNFT